MKFAPELWIKGNTFKGSFSDDYRTFYFFRKDSPDVEKYVPFESEFNNGRWQEPEILKYFDKSYSYTYQLKVPGSSTLLFLSNQPTKTDTTSVPNYNFRSVEISRDTFSEPKEFGYTNLIYNYNSQPSVTKKGTLYFTSDSPDWQITSAYKMVQINGAYSDPELFDPVNQWRQNKDWTVFEFTMSPDEDYMIVVIQDSAATTADLYISHYKNNQWSLPEKLGHDINTPETENFPTLTADGKFLVFTRAFSEFRIIPTRILLKDVDD